MTKQAKKLWAELLRVSLWLASIGLMLASSGIDGAYLAKLMPAGFAWLGLVLNTVSDVAAEVMMYWYGRLQQDASTAKRRRAKWILVIVALLTGYAWLFSWRQLLPPLRAIEQDAATWLAPLVAGFVPVSLAGIGYCMALLSGRIEKERDAERTTERQQPRTERTEPAAATAELAEPFACPHCERTFSSQAAVNAHQREHKTGNGHREPEQEKQGER